MEVSRIRALRGPNLWSRHTAIEAIVSCAGAECSIGDMPGFEDRLRASFPEIGFLQPAGHQEGISMAHVLEVAALSLQKQAGCLVTFSCTVQTVESGVYQVVIEYGEEEVGRVALEIAQALCRSAVEDTPFDLDSALARLRELDEDERLGPSTGSIVQAALACGIPYRRLTSGSMVQFGWGSQQRRIQAAETDGTSAIAQSIAQDKELTKKLLDAAGVPIPFGRPVLDEDDAWAAAEEIGLPVVVKPQDGNQGKGVTVNIISRDHLKIAYAAASAISESIMVERYLPGHDFRLLVVGGKVVAAARRDPPQVIGDGIHTVRELVEIVNRDPRRSEGHAPGRDRSRTFVDTGAVGRFAPA
jgi:cyanophycin synthetase